MSTSYICDSPIASPVDIQERVSDWLLNQPDLNAMEAVVEAPAEAEAADQAKESASGNGAGPRREEVVWWKL